MYYKMKNVFDNIDVICQIKSDGSAIPLKFRLQNEDGLFETYSIKPYKPVPKQGTRTTKDGIYVSNSTEIYECRVVIFGMERTVRLYYSPKIDNRWKLAI